MIFRYSDLYFSTTEYQKAVSDLTVDQVYDQVMLMGTDSGVQELPGNAVEDDPILSDQKESSFCRRRFT